MGKRSRQRGPSQSDVLSSLFPEDFRPLLKATGRELIDRIGPELLRQATVQILLGHNIRTQTEPLTRQRIAEISGALLALFHRGSRELDSFIERLSELAEAEIGATDHERTWPARWALGITGKGVQNVLRSDPQFLAEYVQSFERAVNSAAENLRRSFGELHLSLRLAQQRSTDDVSWNWVHLLRLVTAIGCAELTIRGSDKSRYGKLFERLVLGSVLEILGFRPRAAPSPDVTAVYWLTDARDERECDATAIIRPGSVARFDIGFIGIGNPEIVRDKLSRFARQFEEHGQRHGSTSFIIVDRYPTGPRASSVELARKSGAVLIQMSMSLWPVELARQLESTVDYRHPLAQMDAAAAEHYIRSSLSKVDLSSMFRDARLQVALDEKNEDA